MLIGILYKRLLAKKPSYTIRKVYKTNWQLEKCMRRRTRRMISDVILHNIYDVKSILATDVKRCTPSCFLRLVSDNKKTTETSLLVFFSGVIGHMIFCHMTFMLATAGRLVTSCQKNFH